MISLSFLNSKLALSVTSHNIRSRDFFNEKHYNQTIKMRFQKTVITTTDITSYKCYILHEWKANN